LDPQHCLKAEKTAQQRGEERKDVTIRKGQDFEKGQNRERPVNTGT
jgi:hypothetical protein